jgi:hypothetical protein
MALVQSVIRRLPNSLYPTRKNSLQDINGYKWSLLKVRKGKCKGEHGETQVESAGVESMFFCSSGAFKTYDN